MDTCWCCTEAFNTMLSPSPAGMKVGTSEVNLNSGERSVASWAVGFERLLQDPEGIHYFSVRPQGTGGVGGGEGIVTLLTHRISITKHSSS